MKESSGVLSVREPASAADQPCSFVESYADILLYGAQLVFVNAGAHIHGSIQAVSYPQGPGPASESVQKLVVDFSVHDHATGCCATLTGRAKPSPDRSIHSQVQLCVVHDNDDVLSTHFQVVMLEAGDALAGHCIPHGGGSGKGDEPYILMPDKGQPYFRACTKHQIHDARRHIALPHCFDDNAFCIGFDRCFEEQIAHAGIRL